MPLAELPFEGGAPVYLGKIVGLDGDVYNKQGWFMWDDGLGDFISPDALGTGQVNENLAGWQGVDDDKTMARMLQPGEKLVIELESL